DLAGGWQCRSCASLSNQSVTQEWRYLPRRDINLSCQRRGGSADFPADGPIFSTAQSAARAVLSPEQLAQSPRAARHRAWRYAKRCFGGRLIKLANADGRRRRHLRLVGTVCDRRCIEGLPPAVIEAG